MSGYEEFSSLRLERPVEGVLRVVLDRPDKLNAVDRDMHCALADIWPRIDRDPETRVVLVEGAGGAFSAGGDLEMVKKMHFDEGWRREVFREARDLVLNMIAFGKPVVSAIEGPAVGAGAAVALLADIPVASRSARIIDGHTRIGVVAGDHAVLVWPLLCGLAKAKYHLLTCEPLSGEEAERIGLVALCVDDGEAGRVALEIARRLAEGSQLAIRWTKQALNNWLRFATPIFDTSVALEMLSFTADDVIEGVTSIEERRPPRFTQ